MDKENKSKTKLSEDVLKILNDGLAKGFDNNLLNLNFKGINDSMVAELCEWILKLEGKIKILELGYNHLMSGGASILFDTLDKHKSTIVVMSLCDNYLDDESAESLGNYIKNSNYLETIWLSNGISDENNNFTDKGIEILSKYLEGNKIFKELILTKNRRVTDKSIPFLMKMIETSYITRLNVKITSITEENVFIVPLIKNLLKNKGDRIDIQSKLMTDANIIGICEGIKKFGCEKVKEIMLTKNKITSKGAIVLFETLKQANANVTGIHLSENELDDECMKSLGEFIENSDSIESIKISKNNITNKGIEILSEHLTGNIMLNTLDLSSNGDISDESFPYLTDIIKKSSITSMDLYATAVSNRRRREIYILLQMPIDLRDVPIQSKTKSAAKLS